MKDIEILEKTCICMFLFLFFLKIFTYILEEHTWEERDLYLDLNEDIKLSENIVKHQKHGVAYNHEYKGKVCVLGWDIYIKYEEEVIMRDLFMVVPHPNGGNIVWSCVGDNVIKETQQ